MRLLLVALLMVTGMVAPEAEKTPYNGLLLLAALGFEGPALRLPGWGIYSAAYVPLLTLACSAGGLRWALGGIVLIWLWRGLRWGFALAEPEALALGGAALSAALLAPLRSAAGLASLPVYLMLESLCSSYTARRNLGAQFRPWLGLQRLVQEIRGLSLLAALGLSLVHPEWQMLSFLLLPLLIGYRAVGYGIFRVHSREANQVLAAADRLQASLDSAQRGEYSARAQLSATHEQRATLEEMTRSLGSESRLDQAALQLFRMLRRQGNYASLALLCREGEAWMPLACQSAHASRLENHRLLNYNEPLWDQARRAGTALVLRQDSADRIFVGEAAALAIPMGSYLLYLGRSMPALSHEECQWAIWVAEQACPLLEAIEQRQRQQSALQQTRAQSQHLQGQVTALSGLLEASRLLASSLDWQSMGQLIEQACTAVFPGTAGSLWLRPESASQTWGRLAPGSENAARIGQVVQSQRPWLEGNVLIQPLGSFPGALLIQWPEGGLREDDRSLHEQLGLLGYSVGLAVSNAEHLRMVVEAQAQVLQSSKMAAVGQLAAGVAHELNTPLGAVALALTSVLDKLSDEKAVRRLERAAKSTERCQTIIQKLFIYTRLGSSQSERFRLETLAQDTVNFFRSKTPEIPIEVVVKASVEVAGRIHDLQELLTNLLANAAESVTPKIEVCCQVDQGWGVLSVRDWGAGLDAATLERVFEPFFTTKVIGKNVGLGLSVSREIARQHSGELLIQSALGQGSLVTLRLPAQVQR